MFDNLVQQMPMRKMEIVLQHDIIILLI